MAWFDDLKTPRIKTQISNRHSKVPEGIWVKCPKCGEILQSKVLIENLQVCAECSFHFRMHAIERITLFSDLKNSTPPSQQKTKSVSQLVFEEYTEDLVSTDPLEFGDVRPYRDRLRDTAEKTGCKDAFIAGKTKLGGIPYHLGVFEFGFMGGSMGVVVGEKVATLFERALRDRLPAVIVSASGGARMQEGILSLMQMAKTCALVGKMRDMGIPFISVLTDPTTGGVAASFAFLGDVILAEPDALIGFAGPRVIEQTIKRSLPQGFQRSEFLLQHGFVDRIVSRRNLVSELKQWMLRLGSFTCNFPETISQK